MIDCGRRRFLRAAGTAIVAAPMARLPFMDIGKLAATPPEAAAIAMVTRAQLEAAMATLRARYIRGPFTLVLGPGLSRELKAIGWHVPHIVSEPITAVYTDEEEA